MVVQKCAVPAHRPTGFLEPMRHAVFLNLPEGAPDTLASPNHVGILNFFKWRTGAGEFRFAGQIDLAP
jgi:hypothetical protein